MAEKIYLYPKWVRFWHWTNALFFLALIVSGLSLQYSNPDFMIIPFKASVLTHNISGISVTVLYVIFIVVNHFSLNGDHYRLKKGFVERISTQFKYYTKGIFKNEAQPFPVSASQKFNPLQHITYNIVMYIGMPIIIITGWGMLFPEITIDNFFGQSGLLLTDQLHIMMGFLLSIFLCIHIYFATIGKHPAENFKSMVTGYHEKS